MNILMCVAIGIAALVVAGFLVMLLWNWLIPELFKGPVIKFKHALGLMALSFLLFGGIHGGRGHWGGRHCGAQYENCGSHEKCMEHEHSTEPAK